MAVTIVSEPPVNPAFTALNDEFLITVTSSVYGTAGVTQHRFRADTIALVNLGTRYTVAYQESPDRAVFDMIDVFKTLLWLGTQDWGNNVDIPQITTVRQLETYTYWAFQVSFSEEYYFNGVFTQVAGPVSIYKSARGFTDSPTQLMLYDNWFRRNGLTKFMPYSGHTYQVYPQRTDEASWPSVGAEPWLGFEIAATPGGIVYSVYVSRGAPGWIGFVYAPMYWPGVTDQAAFQKLTITVRTSTVSSGGTIQDQYDIERTYTPCEDTEYLIMFKDSNFQWAFMAFPKKHRVIVNTDAQQAEAQDGRYRYNVESSDTLVLNTDWLFDAQNVLIRELLQSEITHLVDPSDGSLEQVTVVPNSLRLQNSRSDGMFQYTMQFKKSTDNFQS